MHACKPESAEITRQTSLTQDNSQGQGKTANIVSDLEFVIVQMTKQFEQSSYYTSCTCIAKKL